MSARFGPMPSTAFTIGHSLPVAAVAQEVSLVDALVSVWPSYTHTPCRFQDISHMRTCSRHSDGCIDSRGGRSALSLGRLASGAVTTCEQ